MNIINIEAMEANGIVIDDVENKHYYKLLKDIELKICGQI